MIMFSLALITSHRLPDEQIRRVITRIAGLVTGDALFHVQAQKREGQSAWKTII